MSELIQGDKTYAWHEFCGTLLSNITGSEPSQPPLWTTALLELTNPYVLHAGSPLQMSPAGW